VPRETLACWLKRSLSGGRSSGGRERGGGVTSPSSSSSSSSLLSPPEDSGLEGVSSPHSLAAAQAELQARLLCLHTHSHLLGTWLAFCLAASLSKMTPHGVLHAYPRSYAKEKHTCFEKQKLAQLNECEIERTHPWAFDPFP
jgi:hypothetical protein